MKCRGCGGVRIRVGKTPKEPHLDSPRYHHSVHTWLFSAMTAGSHHVAILGCGVIGLSTGLAILEAQSDGPSRSKTRVTIVAKELPGSATSADQKHSAEYASVWAVSTASSVSFAAEYELTGTSFTGRAPRKRCQDRTRTQARQDHVRQDEPAHAGEAMAQGQGRWQQCIR